MICSEIPRFHRKIRLFGFDGQFFGLQPFRLVHLPPFLRLMVLYNVVLGTRSILLVTLASFVSLAREDSDGRNVGRR